MAINTIAQKKGNRLAEWIIWLKNFQDELSDAEKASLETLPNAADLLNIYYWRLAIDFIKPLLQDGSGEEEHNIHYYKIISASELAVMAVLPWVYKDGHPHKPEDRAELNAKFALFVAVSIMLNWRIQDKEVIDVNELNQVLFYVELIDNHDGNSPKYYPDNFAEEHINWLKLLNVNGPLPILSNSQTWRMCNHACMAIRNNGNL